MSSQDEPATGPGSLRGLVETAAAVRATNLRTEKRDRIARYLRTLPPDDVNLAVQYLAGEIPQGRLQLGRRTLASAAGGPAQPSLFDPPGSAPLSLSDVDGFLQRLRETTGSGAAARRRSLLSELMSRADPRERDWLLRFAGGELRQGALRAAVVDAVAAAWEVPEKALRRAIMVAGDFGTVARALARGGENALAAFDLAPLRPVEPMLASNAPDLGEAVEAMGRVAIEWKLDGVRVQVHRDHDDVRVFTRRLRDITASMPEVVALARTLGSDRLILDGEVVGRDAEGAPIPFQDLMSLVSRESDRAGSDAERHVRFFDVLYLDGEILTERPYEERVETLDRLVPAGHRVPRRIVSGVSEAQTTYDEAIAAGHEGVMLKDPRSPYRAGRRGAHWRKAKPAVTVDLVILAAEWGSGRRRGRLSNLHLGARVADAPGRFAMLGKTFKGLTDEMLAQLTEDLPTIEIRRDERTVWVEPRRVVEIAFDGLQRSSRYDSGLALRFARVKRFRPDKGAEEATTLDEIRAIVRRGNPAP